MDSIFSLADQEIPKIEVFLKKCLNLNRTIVSKDNLKLFKYLSELTDVKVFKYKTGNTYESWTVPKAWDLIDSVVKVNDEIIATSLDSILLVAPYSKNIEKFVDYDEFKSNLVIHDSETDAYKYEHRLAGDSRRRLKEWKISLPSNKVKNISKNSRIYIKINARTYDSNLLVGKLQIAGKVKTEISLLSHYCHAGQLNDGLAGLALSMLIYKSLLKAKSPLRYTYSFLTFPETFGSAIYLASNSKNYKYIASTLFSEMCGSNSQIQLVRSRQSDMYIDRLSTYAIKNTVDSFRIVDFKKGWGNDEMIFDSPGIDIPSISIDRHPFRYYHSSNDNFNNFDFEKLREVAEIYLKIITLLESDFIPVPKYRTPIYLSKYNLYSDWTYDRKNYDLKQIVLDNIDTKTSAFDIAYKFNLDFSMVLSFLNELINKKLLLRKSIPADYFKCIL